MTVSIDKSTTTLDGNNSNKNFDFDFKVWEDTDLEIWENINGTTPELVSSDFSITLNSNQETNPGGTVVYPVSADPLTVNDTITIKRGMPFLQETDWINNQKFDAEVIESNFDIATAERQELKEAILRCIQYSPGSSEEYSLEDFEQAVAEAIQAAIDAAASAVLSEYWAGIAQSAVTDLSIQVHETTAVATQTDYTMPFVMNTTYKSISVFVDGVKQASSTYSLPDATTVRFSEAPPDGYGLEFIMFDYTGAAEMKGLNVVPIGDYANNLYTAVTAIGATPTTLFIDSPTLVDQNVIVPNTLDLWFINGGKLYDSNNSDVTINGAITAPYVQKIFDWTGSGQVYISNKSTREVYPEWWGAVGDGVTDDYAAIQNAVNSLAGYGTLKLINGYYKLAGTLNISDYKEMFVQFGPESRIIRASGSQLKLYSPENIVASPQQIITIDNMIIFVKNGGKVYPTWWGALGNGSTDDRDSIAYAANSILAVGGILCFLNCYQETGSKYMIDSNMGFAGYPKVYIEFMPGAKIGRITGDEMWTFINPKQLIIEKNQAITDIDTFRFVNGGTVYPEWWTVDGSDDQIPINRALNSGQYYDVEMIVQLDTKQYNINSDIEVYESHTVLRGEKPGGIPGANKIGTLLSCTHNSSYSAIQLGNGVDACAGPLLENLTIRGNHTFTKTGVTVQPTTTYPRFNNITVEEMKYGFYVNTTVNAIWDKCYVRDCATAGWDLRSIYTGSVLRNCGARSESSDPSWGSIIRLGTDLASSGLKIDGCYFTPKFHSYIIDMRRGGGISITNNIFTPSASSTDHLIRLGSASAITGFSFTGNHISASIDHVLGISDNIVYGATLEGNSFYSISSAIIDTTSTIANTGCKWGNNYINNDTPVFPLNIYQGILPQGWRADEFFDESVNDDDVMVIEPHKKRGQFEVWAEATGGTPPDSEGAIGHYAALSTDGEMKELSATSNVDITTGILSPGEGVDGNLTISVGNANGKFYVSNRLNQVRVISVKLT